MKRNKIVGNNLLNQRIFDLRNDIVFFSGDDGSNQWPDILKFLYECCNSNENRMKEVALHIIM